jgi:hypothetical protein
MKQIGESEASYETLVEASLIAEDLEADASHRVRPARTSRWSFVSRRSIALAATLAGVAIATSVWVRSRSDDGEPAARFAALLGADATLPEPFDFHPGRTVRTQAGLPRTESGRAVRLGARSVDLGIAVRTSDRRQEQILEELNLILDDLTAGGLAQRAYQLVRDSSNLPLAQRLVLVASANQQAAALVDPSPYAMGAWLEAARIAARGGIGSFFTATETNEFFSNATATPGLTPTQQALLGRIRSLATAPSIDYPTLTPILEELLGQIGS